MMRFLFCFMVLVMIAVTSSAQACSCAYGGYWISDFVENKTVFEGKTLRSEWLGEYEAESGRYRLNDAVTTFDVLKPLKDSFLGKISIKHSSSGASCGMTFAMGERTLILAYEREQNKRETNSCTLNAVDEITILKYFENGEDVYIPSWGECTEQQISNPQDPKNCYYLSEQSANDRRSEMIDRLKDEWKARRKTFINESRSDE